MSKAQKIFNISFIAWLILLPLIANIFDEPYLVLLFSKILIYALAALSLDLILGYGGLVSLGHAAFFGLGSYIVAILWFHAEEGEALLGFIDGTQSALIAWPTAMIATGLVAALIGFLSLRTREAYFIMITLAFAQMLFYLFISFDPYGGEDGLSMYTRNSFPYIDLADSNSFYYVILGCLALSFMFYYRLINSRFGRVIQGAKQNEKRMLALGYPVKKYQLIAFIISAMTAALAGGLMTNHVEFTSPEFLTWQLSAEFIVIVLLGGMGTLYGAVIGAAAFLLMEEHLSLYTEHWQVFLGPILVLVVFFARNGLYGLLNLERKQDA